MGAKTIEELNQIIKGVNKDSFNEFKKEWYDVAMSTDEISEYTFEYIIKNILLIAFSLRYPKAFYICYAVGELYNSSEVQLNGNLYRVHMNLANGSMNSFTEAYKLKDVNFYVDKIDVYTKRKQMIRDWFIAAFSNDPKEIETVENYEELHKNLTENILEFACMMIRSRS